MDWCENFDLDSSIPWNNYTFTIRRYRYKDVYSQDCDNNNLSDSKSSTLSRIFRPSHWLRGSGKSKSNKKVDFKESSGILYRGTENCNDKKISVNDALNGNNLDSKMGIQKLKKNHKVFIRKSATLPSHKEAERCIFTVSCKRKLSKFKKW